MFISLVTALTLGLLVWALAEAAIHNGLHDRKAAGIARLERQWASLFLFVDVRKLLLLNTGLMLVAAAVVWLLSGNGILALGTMALFLVAPRTFYQWLAARRRRRFEAQLPDALQTLAGALKAGASLNTGLMQMAQESLPPLSQEIELLVREQRLGVSLDVALGNLSQRMPMPSVVLMVSTVRIAAETGGELAEALGRAASTLRSIAQAEGKIAALTAQGKMQAWVVGLLPLFLLYVLAQMEPEAMAKLWTTQTGWGVMAVIAFLEVMGVWLVRRIVAIDV